MTTRKFKRDWSLRVDALNSVTYRGGRSYPLSEDIERQAEADGALEEKRDRPARSRRKGGTVAPEG